MATTPHQVPEWEAPAERPQRHSFLSKLPFGTSSKAPAPLHKEEESAVAIESHEEPTDQAPVSKRRRMPPWLSSFLANRKLLYGSVAALLLLILIIGLAVGLTRKGKSRALPLPTTNGIFNGDLTYYSPGPGYGACGWENTSEDAICAVSHLVWDAVSTSTNPNHNPLCGKKLRITRFDPKQGRNNSIDVQVVDRCTGCKETDIDLSLKMFEILADEDQGRVVGTWAWLDK